MNKFEELNKGLDDVDKALKKLRMDLEARRRRKKYRYSISGVILILLPVFVTVVARPDEPALWGLVTTSCICAVLGTELLRAGELK